MYVCVGYGTRCGQQQLGDAAAARSGRVVHMGFQARVHLPTYLLHCSFNRRE